MYCMAALNTDIGLLTIFEFQLTNCCKKKSELFPKSDALSLLKSELSLCPGSELSKSQLTVSSENVLSVNALLLFLTSNLDRNVEKLVVIERPKIERVEKVVTITREVLLILSILFEPINEHDSSLVARSQ